MTVLLLESIYSTTLKGFESVRHLQKDMFLQCLLLICELRVQQCHIQRHIAIAVYFGARQSCDKCVRRFVQNMY